MSDLTSDAMSTRQRGKKLSTNKLSALERLKKARAGEKVSDDEAEEEELYEEVDEEEYQREEDKIDKYKREKEARAREKAKRDKKAIAREEEKTAAATTERAKVKRHLTRDKTTGKSGSAKHHNDDDAESGEDGEEEDDEDQENAKKGHNMDIRAAFFKAAAKPKPSPPVQVDKKLTTSAASNLTKPSKHRDDEEAMDEDGGDGDGGDDLMNEIMKELKKQTTATSKPVNRATKLSGAAAHNLTLSPAHKRKLSPSTGQRHSPPGSSESKAKKLDLDSVAVSIKDEPVDLEDASEELDNLALSNLNLDSVTPVVKREPVDLSASFLNNSSMMTATNPADAMDLEAHMKTNSDRLLFYWFDAHEDLASSTVYFFGKMPVTKQETKESKDGKESKESAADPEGRLSFMSACCVVKNTPHDIYVLPRKYKKSSPDSPVTMQQLTSEVEALLHKSKIHNFKTRVVRKCYAFDRRSTAGASSSDLEDVPYDSEYLHVEYQGPKLPAEIQGECFSVVFGTQTPMLEKILISLKIKGPCWMLASNARRVDGAMVSWCKVEYVVDNYRSLGVYREGVTLDQLKPEPLPTTPPLTTLTLMMRTMLNTRSQEHEIVCVACQVTPRFYLEKPPSANGKGGCSAADSQKFVVLTRPAKIPFPHDLDAVVKLYRQKYRSVIETAPNERSLLAFLMSKITCLDVDVIIGHDLFGCNLDILLNRCLVNKVPNWSRLGRLRRSQMPGHGGNHGNRGGNTTGYGSNMQTQQRILTVCAGRVLCDVMISAKELLTKCKSYDLNELAVHIMGKKDPSVVAALKARDFEEEKNVANFYNSSQQMINFMTLCMQDATNVSNICNEILALQLAYQITCIAGNVLSRTLTGGRSERNEYLLMHAFYDKDFILPEKFVGGKSKPAAAVKGVKKEKEEPANYSSMTLSATQMHQDDDDDELINATLDGRAAIKSEPSAAKTTHSSSSNGYAGGLVLEPRVGFYDRFILLLDFNSLYPSIIQEYNICFTTISRPNMQLAERDIEEYLDTCIKLPGEDEKPGILPLEIRKLVDSRRQVKQLLQDKNISESLRQQYDIRQKALKLTANSMYGCLGFEMSRFYCKPLAALITKFGRNILMKTKELVESKKIEVIYGDTDSIMINTNLNDYDQVFKLGIALKSEVNKFYKHLEIDIDGVFRALLLLKKKKYAALTVTGRSPTDPKQLLYQQEIKGLDVVRRDWCLLAKQIGEKVIGEILSGQPCDTVLTNINKILTETGEKIRNNGFDLGLFEISKQLQRNPEDYNDANHQSHVIVALRHNSNKSNSKRYKSGDVVSYIICEDGSTNSATQRAYSKSELVKNADGNLKLDIAYYLRQQVHPVISRMCEPIEGIDAAQIAELLGLDPAGFKKSYLQANGNVKLEPVQLTKQQKKLESYMNEIERFSNCVPFKYTCPACKTEATWQTPFVKTATGGGSGGVKEEPKVKMDTVDSSSQDDDLAMLTDIKIDVVNSAKRPLTSSSSSSSSTGSSTYKSVLEACSNPQCKHKPLSRLAYIKNLLTLQMNKHIKQYYQGWVVCEDPMCSCRTKRISCKFFQGRPQCIDCERYAVSEEYGHADLYYQMRFYKFIFDAEAFKSYYKDDSPEIAGMLKSNKDLANGLAQLREFVAKRLKLNAYGTVSFGELFRFV